MGGVGGCVSCFILVFIRSSNYLLVSSSHIKKCLIHFLGEAI